MVIKKPENPQHRKIKRIYCDYRVMGKTFKVSKSILKEIKNQQLTTALCIPKLPFSKVVREILMEFSKPGMRVEKRALSALHEASELYMVQLFEDASILAHHARRITIRPIDFRVVLDVKGPKDPAFDYKT